MSAPCSSTESVWKYVGITAATGAAVGFFLHFARKDDRNIVEIERLQMMVEVLGTKIEDLELLLRNFGDEVRNQKTIRSANGGGGGGALKNVTFKLEASSSSRSVSYKQMPRTRSWTSITSDSEYGDAEDEW